MAQQQPFAPSFSPFVTPSLLAQQLRMQQTAQFGQQMLQEGQQVPQGQMVSGHFVAPSPLQYAAQLLKTSAGRQAVDSLPDMYGQMVQANQARAQALFGLSGGGAAASTPPGGGAQSFPVGPSGSPQQPPSIGGMQPPPQMLAAGPQGQRAPAQPQMPLLPGKTPQQSYQIFSLVGPAKYAELVATQGAPTDIVKNLITAGIDPNSAQGRAVLNAAISKATANNINVRPGGTVYDANAGRAVYHAPTTGGAMVADTAAGPVMYMVPGAEQANNSQSISKALGPASFRTGVVNLPGGQNIMMTDAQRAQWLTNEDRQDPYLMAVLSTESGGNPNAVSPKGAVGPMQTMPGTLAAPGFGVQPAADGSVQEKMRVGRDYWQAMNQRYGNPALAAIAYNMGPGAADQWLSAGGDFSKLPPETQKYVASVMTKAAVNGRGQQQPTAPGAPGRAVQGEGTIAFNQALGKNQASELTASRKAAITATDDLTNIAKERQALAAGTFGGSGAQARLSAVKFLQGWVPGLSSLDASKVTDTDYLVSVLGKGLLMHAKDLGYNPTDTDATRIEAIVGTIGKDPGALAKIIDYQEMMAKRAIQRHNLLVTQAQKNGVQSSFDMSVSPQTGMPGTQEFQAAPPASGFKIIGVR